MTFEVVTGKYEVRPTHLAFELVPIERVTRAVEPGADNEELWIERLQHSHDNVHVSLIFCVRESFQKRRQ